MRRVKYDVPYTYRGETHLLSEWADILGIRYVTLSARARRGITGNKLFVPPRGYGKIPKLHIVNGHTGTLAELCKLYDVPYSTVLARIRLGRTLEQALTQRRYQKLAELNRANKD